MMSEPVDEDYIRAQAVKEERRRIRNEVRALVPMQITNTDYVPAAKRRPDSVIDRASVLQIVDKVRGRLTDPHARETR